MTKVAILTQPLHNNYGGILQNFALQEILKDLQCDPITLNIHYKNHKTNLIIRILKIIKRFGVKVLGDESIIFLDVDKQVNFLNSSSENQKRFIEKNIKKIDFYSSLTSEFETKYNFDLYIVGSDQVWRPSFSPYLKNFFLDFLKDSQKNKIAYAASFGIDRWNENEKMTGEIKKLLKKFDAISVREDFGKKICEDYFGVTAEQVFDPTLLINKDKYIELASDFAKPEANNLCAYLLDNDKEKTIIANDILNHFHLKINRVGQPTKKGFPSIESWLNGFIYADFVVTDSFHGTVFAILFNKNFVVLGNEGRGNSRFESLLRIFGLKYKLVTSKKDYFERKKEILQSIDYNSVNLKMQEERKKSLDFLINNLKSNNA